ncbi:hypothetical protein JTB14_032856 [Gonioctena quinquepunctata]|nr:hypothetical protein JTB14_032856 [Gonioctena quinquepunctata]
MFDLPATPIEHTLFNLPQSLIQSERDAGTKSSPREIDGKQSEMEQEHSDPDYIEENDTDNTDSSDVEDADSASIGEAEAKENVDPSYGGELSKMFDDLYRKIFLSSSWDKRNVKTANISFCIMRTIKRTI